MLRQIVADKILNEVLPSVQSKSSSKGARRWKILVLDPLATHLLNWCCTMKQLTDRDVTLVEDIDKKRQPADFDALYICSPSERNIQMIADDFDSQLGRLYKVGHIFFLTPCEDEHFQRLVRSSAFRFIKTIKEVNVAFMPVESRVYSLAREDDAPKLERGKRLDVLEKVAEQIATVCATLREYPNVRHRKGNDISLVLAELVQQKLDQLKIDDPEIGKGYDKAQSQLIILDRGFDCATPLLHELTYQAMAYDLLHFDDKGTLVQPASAAAGSDELSIVLDENDDKWVDLRHGHIAQVLKKIAGEYREFSKAANEASGSNGAQPSDSGTSGGHSLEMKRLRLMIKRMPQHQKQLHQYATHMRLTEDCLQIYNRRELETLCLAEQGFATGSNSAGERIRDPMRTIVPVLLDSKYSAVDKLRIIALYIIWKGSGIPAESLNKLIQHAQISTGINARRIIQNLSHLGVTVLSDREDGGSSNAFERQAARRNRDAEGVRFETSRWTPIVKDIMEEAIEGTLPTKQYPYLAGFEKPPAKVGSARQRGQWARDQDDPLKRYGPRLIVFILGGATFSETRSAYEVSEAYKLQNWEVIIGSTHLLTPQKFIDNLDKMDVE